jgi:hypoxanthine phosphoribosyltransferase
LLVGVLKGSVVFLTQLLLELTCEVEIDFMTVSSYKHGTESTDFKLVQDLDTHVVGRDVLIVEDIIDTGKTVKFLRDYLLSQGAKTVEIATLVDKPTRRKVQNHPPRYVGFHYNDEAFIVGHGFDYMEKYRNLPDVYQLEDSDKK